MILHNQIEDTFKKTIGKKDEKSKDTKQIFESLTTYFKFKKQELNRDLNVDESIEIIKDARKELEDLILHENLELRASVKRQILILEEWLLLNSIDINK